MTSKYPPIIAIVLAEGQRTLRQRQTWRSLVVGAKVGAGLGIFFALVLLVASLVSRFLLGSSGAGGWLTLAMGLGPVLIGALICSMVVFFRQRSDQAVAMVLDREANKHNHLATAVEFLHLPERSPFQEVAIQDGMSAAMLMDPVALLTPPVSPWRSGLLRLAGILILATLVALVPAGLPSLDTIPQSSPGPLPLAGNGDGPGQGENTPKPDQEGRALAKTKAHSPGDTNDNPGTDPVTKNQENPTPKPILGKRQQHQDPGASTQAGKGGRKGGKNATGDPREATGGQAGSSAGAAQADGSPAGGAGKPGKRKPTKPSAKKKPKTGKKLASRSRKPQDKAMSGGAMAAGSSRMGGSFSPVSHRWETRDTGGEEDSGGDDMDQEADEEKRRSRQRGGMQPSLRDRRPPGSRDLGLSAPGDEPGKGRGGPTPPKKSRGTAAMILGLPVPDTVKGLPNPGTSRVEQERIAPRAAPKKPAPGKRPITGERAEPPLQGGRAGGLETNTIKRYFKKLRGANQVPAGGTRK